MGEVMSNDAIRKEAIACLDGLKERMQSASVGDWEESVREYSEEWLRPKTGLSRDLCLRMLEVAVRGLRMARGQ